MEPLDVEVPPPGPGEVWLRQTAVGVNYIDVYIRNGAYAGMLTLPGTLGMEAAGTVLDIGPGVTNVFPGDRVAYLSPLPDDIGDEAAASLMLKGITAQYLLHDLGHVEPGMRVLVHAAAGGVGPLVCQWAHALGAVMIGCVSTEAKARVAREHGCAHVIVTGDYRFVEAVLQTTGGRGADLILDGQGDAAAEQNLRALAMRGHRVSYGQASGALRAPAPEALSEKSATFSRPVVFHSLHGRARRAPAARRSCLRCGARRHAEALRAPPLPVGRGRAGPCRDRSQTHDRCPCTGGLNSGALGTRHLRSTLPFDASTGWHWHDMDIHVVYVLKVRITDRFEG